jgi:transposase
LVYQIDDLTRLLWVGKERTEASFQRFFSLIGPKLSSQIEFVCSDMWKPYLNVNGEDQVMRRKASGGNKKPVTA